jgi:hypothetical protein
VEVFLDLSVGSGVSSSGEREISSSSERERETSSGSGVREIHKFEVSSLGYFLLFLLLGAVFNVSQREIIKARQQLLSETRNATQVACREKAHKKLEHKKTQELSEKSKSIVEAFTRPTTKAAEVHPLGTLTGGTKLIDFTRTRLHATVTKYPPLHPHLNTENVEPIRELNSYPTPHNTAKEVLANEPNRIRLQQEAERRRSNAIEVRSEKAKETVQLAKVSAQVEMAFKNMAEKERQHRLLDAR